MEAIINFFTGTLNTVAWLYIFLPCTIVGGLYLTIRNRGIQFTRFGYAMKNTVGKMFQKQEAGAGAVTPLQAVTTALAATVGTGNIVGTSQAIALGGYGAVFWLWLAALLGMMIKYSEVTLSIQYRERDAKGDWVGGPMYYVKNGLGKHWQWVGILFCVFAAIASFVLESGGVVFGAAMDSDMRVVHTAIQKKEDLPRLMGAKLVQSDMGECFQQVRYYLDRGTGVFFTGTPCQVDGLYRFLGESPERLLTADILCGGVPSPGVWSKMVDSMHYIKQRPVKAVQFCKKNTGSDSRYVVDFEGGGQYDAPLTKSDYGRGLFRGLFLRPACYHCTCCTTNRPADLTLGNFLGLPPDFRPDQQKLGVSMLLINSVKGAHFFDMIPLQREKRTLQEALKNNPALSHAAASPKERAAFFDAFVNQPFHKVYQRFFAISDWSYGVANGGRLQKLIGKLKSGHRHGHKERNS